MLLMQITLQCFMMFLQMELSNSFKDEFAIFYDFFVLKI